MRQLRLSKSCITQEEKRAVMSVLDRGYLGMGPEVRDFENDLTSFFGRPATCIVNGTAALHLALQGIGIKSGDEVLVQSLTYVASFQAITAAGGIPIACDFDPDTGCIDLIDARQRVSDKTKAIMPVHYAGGVGDLDELYKFAEEYDLRVIEDAAHAFGTEYKGSKVGSFGDIACFSFDGIKNITSGEGGCIVTDDPMVLERIRDARQLGVEQDSERRFAGLRSWNPNVLDQGWRYHMSDIMAAIGRIQLKNFDHHRTKRQSLAKEYSAILAEESLVTLFNHDYEKVVPHIFVVILDPSVDRSKLMDILSKSGVPTGIHYKPNHLLSFFHRKGIRALPITEEYSSRLLTLPLHPELTRDDVRYITTELREHLRDA
ncbi:MAG: aminotransferase [Gammaproteobacteria bacterium]|nr:aminotransferase [Gammaproteobacteria bacterium]|tara:strand:+ start:680 stop:1804 length:1125 start_codon:yes stop_codon:yes gene_type:complete